MWKDKTVKDQIHSIQIFASSEEALLINLQNLQEKLKSSNLK